MFTVRDSGDVFTDYCLRRCSTLALMWQEGDHQAEPALLDAEIRSVRTELDEVTARRRGALDRYDVVSLVLMVVGLVVFASAAVASYAAGQNGRGQVFAVLTLL